MEIKVKKIKKVKAETIPAIKVEINGIAIDIDTMLKNLQITEEEFIKATEKKKEKKKFSPIKGLLDIVMKDVPKNQRQKVGSAKGYDVNKPSEKPMWACHKKKSLNAWTSQDFLGYYLNLYREHVGEEDPEFMTHTYGQQKIYVIKAFLNVFDNDHAELKKYLEWVIPWIVSEESWVDPIVNFSSVFGRKGPFLKNFKARDIKKSKGNSRTKDDNFYADKNNWNT